LEQWRTGHFRVFPLPDLRQAQPEENLVADFELLGSVLSAELAATTRICCLSDYGLTVLQQRRVHHDTRVVLELDVLHEQAAPNLEEAELLQEWLEELVVDQASQEQVARETGAFDAFLSADDHALRHMLKDLVERAKARKAVRSEIRLRAALGD
jgi:Na+-transporting NADH:ubiquinone oxidoreductase subunit NqrC